MTQRDLNYTSNGELCPCGAEHNSLRWIVRAVLHAASIQAQRGVILDDDQIAQTVEKVALDCGFVRARDELDALRGYVADYDALIDMPTVEPVQRDIRYDLINDTVYTDPEDEE